jgi:hypothetical protein
MCEVIRRKGLISDFIDELKQRSNCQAVIIFVNAFGNE